MKIAGKIFIIIILASALLLPAAAVFAQGSAFIPECILNRDIAGGQCGDNVDIFITLAINIGRYLFSFIGALALLFFVYGGVILITSQGNKENVSKGTKAMVAAVTGLVIAFSGYALITFLSQSIGVKAEFLINPQNTAQKK